jgi:Peptidase A4 family
MQRQNCRFLKAGLVIAAAIVFLASTSTFMAAQSEAAKAIYDASATVATNIAGIRTFNAPPAHFNPLTASEEDNALYGFPPRPDPQKDAAGYAKWARAMSHPQRRWNGNLKVTDFQSQPARAAKAPSGASSDISAVPTTKYFYNWSGVINSNALTKYNGTGGSYYYVISDFNVPVAQQAFGGVCDGGWDLEVSWNGIDGYKNGNALLQGGSYSGAYCSGSSRATSYFAWFEWWPAYSIIAAYNVNPGDDMFVETWDTSSTNGYVYLYDETLNYANTYNITSNGGPGLIGNSAEYIVERPCCRSGFNYPLANYVQDFWTENFAYSFYNYNHSLPTPAYSGSTSPSTVNAIMVNDQDSQSISYSVTGGKYDLVFYDENCAYSGGCTP